MSFALQCNTADPDHETAKVLLLAGGQWRCDPWIISFIIEHASRVE